MNRIEFIEKLQRALAGGLNSRQVAENVRYYQEYIDMEIRKGRKESEVLEGLGDPRLLAKSIIEANKRAGRSAGTNLNYDEEVADSDSGQTYSQDYGYRGDEEGNPYEDTMTGKVFRMPGWLLLLIVTVVVLLIIGVAFSLISVLAPILIPVLIVMLIIKLFQSNQ